MANETQPPPELLKALDEVRREVIEARNMTIKTDNALKSLHAELKVVSLQQDRFERRSWMASATAYLGFLVLAAGGAFAMTQVRAAAAQSEREHLERQSQELSALVAQQKAEAAAAGEAERAALEAYRGMTNLAGEERLKGVEALAKLDARRVHPLVRQLLEDRAAVVRREVGAAVLERGRGAFRRQDWAEAAQLLTRASEAATAGEEQLEVSYMLGYALAQLRKHAEAAGHLTRFVEGDKRSKVRELAMALLVQAHEATGDRDKAMAVARDALSTYPAGQYRGTFAAALQRRGGEVPPGDVTGPANVPGGGAPAAPVPAAAPGAAPGALATPPQPRPVAAGVGGDAGVVAPVGGRPVR